MSQIKKGEDKQVTITVESNNVAFNITGYNVVVIVYSNEIGVIGRFSNTQPFKDDNQNEYDPITVTDASEGVIDFVLTSAMTSKAQEGACFAVVKLRQVSGDTYIEADPVKLGIIRKTPATNVKGF
jgi:hypothetical protein